MTSPTPDLVALRKIAEGAMLQLPRRLFSDSARTSLAHACEDLAPGVIALLDLLSSQAEEIERLRRSADKDEALDLETIDQRDAAEEALSQAYYLIIGRSPEWSNHFGAAEALEEIDDAQTVLRKSVQASEATIARMRESLQDVQNPLGRLRRLAEERGERLGGMAYTIANSLGYVQSIATDELATLADLPSEGGGK